MKGKHSMNIQTKKCFLQIWEEPIEDDREGIVCVSLLISFNLTYVSRWIKLI